MSRHFHVLAFLLTFLSMVLAVIFVGAVTRELFDEGAVQNGIRRTEDCVSIVSVVPLAFAVYSGIRDKRRHLSLAIGTGIFVLVHIGLGTLMFLQAMHLIGPITL